MQTGCIFKLKLTLSFHLHITKIVWLNEIFGPYTYTIHIFLKTHKEINESAKTQEGLEVCQYVSYTL